MKQKYIIFVFIFAFSITNALSSQAQIIFTEDFESTVDSSLPSGWSQVSTNPNAWKSGTNTTLQGGGFNIDPHTRFVGINDAISMSSNNNSCLLKTPAINFSGVSNAYLSFVQFYEEMFQWESLWVEVSTDNGVSWTILDTIDGSISQDWEPRTVSLAAVNNQPSVIIAFRYSDLNGWVNGVAIDDIQVYVPVAYDVAVDSIAFPKITEGNEPVKFFVRNKGNQAVTSLMVNYTLDGGTPVSQNFTGLNIIPFTTTELTFATNVGITPPASHALVVKALQINSNADADTTDNLDTVIFFGASQHVTRAGLIEKFTSSTCGPCAGQAIWMDPMFATNHANIDTANFNVIKYQMDWPNAGDDASYNQHGEARRAFYGTTGIPEHFVNGAPGLSQNVQAGMQNEINQSKVPLAFMDINGTYTVQDDSLFINVNCIPYFTGTGNWKVHIAVVEKHYQNPNNTYGQLDYYDVMRQMFADGNGNAVSNWTNAVPQSFTFSAPFIVGNVTQNSYNLWHEPLENSNLVVFVQDVNTKEVLQSKVIAADTQAITTTVQNINADPSIFLYTDHILDKATLQFSINKSSSMQLAVTDIAGRTVYTLPQQKYERGTNKVSIPLQGLSEGIYNVRVLIDGKVHTKRIPVL